jgi:hypothetical protein
MPEAIDTRINQRGTAFSPFSMSTLGLFIGSRILGGATIDLSEVELTTTSPPSFLMVVSIFVGCFLSSSTAFAASENSNAVVSGRNVPQPERSNVRIKIRYLIVPLVSFQQKVCFHLLVKLLFHQNTKL